MNSATDEILMAYVDGALGAEQSAAVERLLRVNCHARRVAVIFRATALCVREAFAPLDFANVPERLSAVLVPGSPPVEAKSRTRLLRWLLASVTVLALGLSIVAGEARAAHGTGANDNFLAGNAELPAPKRRKISTSPFTLRAPQSCEITEGGWPVP